MTLAGEPDLTQDELRQRLWRERGVGNPAHTKTRHASERHIPDWAEQRPPATGQW